MKRIIRASKYSQDADKNLKWLGLYGEALSKLSKATDLDEAKQALSNLGHWGNHVKSIPDAVKGVIDNMGFIASDYLLSTNADKRLPGVRDTIVDYLKGLGYEMTKMKTPPRGSDESYVIIPADECVFEDLKTVASAVSHDFGLKPDTGVIGGSWTSYQFKMDGVAFRIGFEDDRDFDPTGKESSLQLYF